MSKKFDFAVGGQALIEGVMMRSKNYVAMSCRDKKGEIKTKSFFFNTITQKYKFLNIFILRGFLNMIQMISLGSKALNYSIDIAFEEEGQVEESGSVLKTMVSIFNIIFSLSFALFLFKFLPLYFTGFIEQHFVSVKESYLLFNAVDAGFKILMFLIYLGFISMMPDIKRLFMYHGAEHMAVFNYESNEDLSVKNTMKQPRLHPRCGTSFVLFVFVASIFVYMFIPKNPDFLQNFLQRIVLLPVIAGLSFEILKMAGKYSENPIVKLLSMPGMALQLITTSHPTDDMAEVAIVALNKTLELENNHQE